MPYPALSATLARATRSVARSAGSDPTDGQLLARFVQDRDEDAFAELVRRLGPMVLGVCRRVTGDHHLAEDAFQAAFLVLARRANDVRPRDVVRGWVFGVAVRTAKGARTVSARRRAREVPVPALPDCPAPSGTLPDAEAVAFLDEEIGALPDHLRTAVVLCELDGLGRKEAADRLKVPEGTLSSRLAKARKLLAKRLRSRGVVTPAAALGGLGLADVAVPARLLAKTSVLPSNAAISPAVAGLANGVIRTVFLQKLKTVVCTVVQFAVAIAATKSLVPTAAAEEPRKPQPVPLVRAVEQVLQEKKPPAKPAATDTFILSRHGPCQLFDLDGKKLAELPLPANTHCSYQAVLSPDGKWAAFLAVGRVPPTVEGMEDKPLPFKLVVQKLGDPKSVVTTDMPALGLNICWNPDGKRLVLSKLINAHEHAHEHTLFDPHSGESEQLKLPAEGKILEACRDGKTFLMEVFDAKTKTRTIVQAVPGEDKVQELVTVNSQPDQVLARLSPDGKPLLFTDADPERKDFHKWGISQRPYRFDLATKKREPLADFPENGQAVGIAWSPDGKRIAYTWKQLHAEVFKKDTIKVSNDHFETEGFLIVADADGKNPKTVCSEKISNAFNSIYGTVDWR